MNNHQLLSHDVKSEYISCRKLGLGREAAVQKLLEAYSEELQDPDDAPAVIEGIVCALRIKRERLLSSCKVVSAAFLMDERKKQSS